MIKSLKYIFPLYFVSQWFFKNTLLISKYPKNEGSRRMTCFQTKYKFFFLCIFKKDMWILFNLCQITNYRFQLFVFTALIIWGNFELVTSYMLLGINISYGVVCQRASLIGKRTLHQHHRTWQMPLKPWRHCQGHSHSGLWKLPALEVSPFLHIKNKTRDKTQPSPFQPTFNFQNFTLEPLNGRTGKCPWWSLRTAPLPTAADLKVPWLRGGGNGGLLRKHGAVTPVLRILYLETGETRVSDHVEKETAAVSSRREKQTRLSTLGNLVKEKIHNHIIRAEKYWKNLVQSPYFTNE